MPHLEQGVAVPQQVLWGDAGCHAARRGLHKLSGLPGSDVLHDHPQPGVLVQQGLQDAVYERGFPVKEVDVRVRHLPVNQEQQVKLRQHAACIGMRGHPEAAGACQRCMQWQGSMPAGWPLWQGCTWPSL